MYSVSSPWSEPEPLLELTSGTASSGRSLAGVETGDVGNDASCDERKVLAESRAQSPGVTAEGRPFAERASSSSAAVISSGYERRYAG